MLTSNVVFLVELCPRQRLGWLVTRLVHSQQARKPSRYSEYFRTLGLAESSSKSSVRQKYIELVKLYHPDTNIQDSDKFNKIDLAYKELMKKFQEDKLREEEMVGEYGLYYDNNKMCKEEEEEEESEHPDIRHVAPQHRQFLDNPFGYGPPAQRQRQAQKYKVFRANEAVYEHRVGRLTAQYEDRLVTRERNTIKKQHTRNQIDRLVEDLIVESIAAGEFDNLEGFGKPLPTRVDYNPYSDFTTHKMNQILVETGFAPEWVQLQKDIRELKVKIRGEMRAYRQRLGPAPLNRDDFDMWNNYCANIQKEEIPALNRMIEKFNLIVPNMNNQMFLFNFQADADKMYNTGYDPTLKVVKEAKQSHTKLAEANKIGKQKSSLLSGLLSFLNR